MRLKYRRFYALEQAGEEKRVPRVPHAGEIGTNVVAEQESVPCKPFLCKYV